MYYNGLGIDEAFEWYMKAAKQGHADSQFSLGYMYYYGTGVDKDRQEAIYWFKKAAENGNMKAKSFLNSVYR